MSIDGLGSLQQTLGVYCVLALSAGVNVHWSSPPCSSVSSYESILFTVASLRRTPLAAVGLGAAFFVCRLAIVLARKGGVWVGGGCDEG